MGAITRETLKQRLYAGKAAFGVMCTFPSPPVVEMLGYLGFDWILPDNEHGSITVDTAESYIAAAELSGMAPIVRPVEQAGDYRAVPGSGRMGRAGPPRQHGGRSPGRRQRWEVTWECPPQVGLLT